MTLYRALFGRDPSEGSKVRGSEGRTVLGLRAGKLAGADVFVLPNPSGRNANFTYAGMLDAFRALRSYLDSTTRSR